MAMTIREMVAKEMQLEDRCSFITPLDARVIRMDGGCVSALDEPKLYDDLRAVLECHRNQAREELNELRARIDALEPKKEKR